LSPIVSIKFLLFSFAWHGKALRKGIYGAGFNRSSGLIALL
jgi:hypothetical protein